MTAIEKVRCLEKHLRQNLSEHISEFENCYSINSAEFYRRYEKGDMGDDMDFIEWASTIEMIGNIDKRLYLLKSEIS